MEERQMSQAITRAIASTNVQVRLEKYLYIPVGTFCARDEWILNADVISIFLPFPAVHFRTYPTILVEFHMGLKRS
jgi:hypothetical protein